MSVKNFLVGKESKASNFAFNSQDKLFGIEKKIGS